MGQSQRVHKRAARQFSHYEARRLKKRRSPLMIVLTVVLALVVIGGLGFAGYSLYQWFGGSATTGGGEEVSVTIPSAATADDIARILKEKGVIASETAFKTELRNRGADSQLKPGSYVLYTGMNTDELIRALVAGPTVAPSSTLLIREGLTVEQTAAAVQEACGIPAADFTALAYSASTYVGDYPFLEGVYNNSMEGFLYPKTYSIPEGASADYVIRTLLNQFTAETTALDMSYATAANLTLYDVVTIASLIEKETSVASERELVASVIYNRLRAGMPLQIDATVVYALGPSYDGHALLYSDLEVDSPYNTYRVQELPAGPICSPYIESLKAAAQPAETDYLYYVATPEGGSHTFCATPEEFEAAKAAYNTANGL
jgi:UPF0755 protein